MRPHISPELSQLHRDLGTELSRLADELIYASVDIVESSVNIIEPLIDIIEPPIDIIEPPIDIGAKIVKPLMNIIDSLRQLFHDTAITVSGLPRQVKLAEVRRAHRTSRAHALTAAETRAHALETMERFAQEVRGRV